MDIEIEPFTATEPAVEDELMEYEDDAAIEVDDAPLEASTSASGEEDAEMDDEVVAVVPELEMSELAPEAEVVVAPEVILADAEVEEQEKPEEIEAAALKVSVLAEVAPAEVETVEAEDEVPVHLELDQEQVEADSTIAPETSPSQPMGSDFFDYGHHDGSGDEALHASGSEYYDEEEQEYDESEALVDILVAFDSIQVPLFSLAQGSDSVDQETLLNGRTDELCHAPLAELLAALRSECEQDDNKKEWIKAGEMCLEEENMGLYVGEDNHHAHSITLAQILDLYKGCQIESPMVLHISFVPDEDRFITRFRAIEREVLAQADKAGLEHDEVDELEGQGVEDDAFEDQEQEEPDQHDQLNEQQEQVSVPLPSDEPVEVEEEPHDVGRDGIENEAEAEPELEVETEAREDEAEALAGAEVDPEADPGAEDEAAVAGEEADAVDDAVPESSGLTAHQDAVEEDEPAQGVNAETSAEEAVDESGQPVVPTEDAASFTQAQPVGASSPAAKVAEAFAETAEAVGAVDDADDAAVDGNEERLSGEQVQVPVQEADNSPGLATEAEGSAPAEASTETAEADTEAPTSGPDDGQTNSDAPSAATLPAAATVAPLPTEPTTPTTVGPVEAEQDGAEEDETFGDEDDQFGIDAVVNAVEKQTEADDVELDFAGGEVDDEALVGRVEESYEGDEIPEGVDVNDPEGDEVASDASSRTISADEEPIAEAVDGALALAHSMLPVEEDSAWPEDDAQDDDFYDQENEAEWQDDNVDADADANADAANDENFSAPETTGFVAAAVLVETRSRSPKRTLEEDDDGKAEREVRQKR